MSFRRGFLALSILAVSIAAFWRIPPNGNLHTALAATEADYTLTILHTNDIHAHYSPYNNDGSACTVGDACTAGVCQGAAVTCAATPCSSAGVCDPSSGLCKGQPFANGPGFNDGNV